MAIWADGRLLLVQQSYQRLLAFPGGGVNPTEAPAEAARRELHEELRLDVTVADLSPACVAVECWDGRIDTVSFFELHLPQQPTLRLDRREILAASFLTPAELPRRVAPQVEYYLRWRRLR